mgnify:FL=1|tara:strand:- start:2646 stop:4082 length:1437 start_codon:yes stop_codon:yes gene_type:complete
MAAIITEKFRLHNAKEFKQSATESGNAMYMFIGRPLSWTDDSNPPTPVDSLNDEYDAYANMTALKKVSSTDVSHAIIRRDWISGTVYDEYRHNYTSSNTANSGASTLWASRFFVVTSDYNVYKVISNNNGGNSTVMPTGTSTNILTTGDGYKWKYMYSISASDVIKFVTSDFIPVKTLGAKAAVEGDIGGLGTAATDDNSTQWDVENAAVDGTIEHARVTAGGSSYGSDGNYNVAVSGDGASGQLQVTVSSGAITAVTVNAVGSGYSVASIDNSLLQTATSSSGTGATFDVIISPKNGHGSDPVEELGGNYVIVNSRLEYAEGSGDFPTDNDFRQIGLIVNPTNSGGNTLSSASTLSALNRIALQSGATMPAVDSTIASAASITSGTATGKVVSVDSTNRYVYYLPSVDSVGNFNAFANSNGVFVGSTQKGTILASGGISSAYPEIQRNSGDIVYLENRGAVARAADQIEDIKLIIEM